MNNFIYEKYGYFVENNDIEFSYQDWDFKLISHQKDENELFLLNNFLMEFDQALFAQGAQIIRSKDNHYGIISVHHIISLIGVKHYLFDIDKLFSFHQYLKKIPSSNQENSLTTLKELWVNKIKLMEDKIIPFLKNKRQYDQYHIAIIQGIGLASNAISYLNDIILDYGDQLSNLVLAHKRITNFNARDIMNPFNFIIDSPLRDYAELYKYGSLNIENIPYIISLYQFDIKQLSYFLARVLFPTPLFDLIEDCYLSNNNKDIEINNYLVNNQKYLNSIIKLDNLLSFQYGVKHISWLENKKR